jgi:hypothetical protein
MRPPPLLRATVVDARTLPPEVFLAHVRFKREAVTNKAIAELYNGHNEIAEFYEIFANLMELVEQDLRYGQRTVEIHPP